MKYLSKQTLLSGHGTTKCWSSKSQLGNLLAIYSNMVCSKQTKLTASQVAIIAMRGNCPLSCWIMDSAEWVVSYLYFNCCDKTLPSLIVSFTELSWLVLLLCDDYQLFNIFEKIGEYFIFLPSFPWWPFPFPMNNADRQLMKQWKFWIPKGGTYCINAIEPEVFNYLFQRQLKYCLMVDPRLVWQKHQQGSNNISVYGADLNSLQYLLQCMQYVHY